MEKILLLEESQGIVRVTIVQKALYCLQNKKAGNRKKTCKSPILYDGIGSPNFIPQQNQDMLDDDGFIFFLIKFSSSITYQSLNNVFTQNVPK